MKAAFSSLASAALSAAALFFVSSCKKDSGNPSASNTYYLSASVNGSGWTASLPLDTAGDIVTAILSGTSSGSFGVVVGGHIEGDDTSAIEVIFPMNFALNEPIAFNNENYTVGLYSPDMSAAQYYLTPKDGKAGDSLTITSFDQDNQIIAGTFKGVFPAVSGSDSVTITNGQFKTKYIVDASASSGNGMTIKF